MDSTALRAFTVIQALLGAHRDITSALTTALADDGASIDQWRVMHSLTDHGRTMGDLNRALDIPPASLTRVVDALATQALVFRRPDAADGRLVVIHLSSLGAERLAQLDDTAVAGLEAARDRLGRARFDLLVTALDKLHQGR